MTGTMWLAQRAMLAIVLMVTFYLLAAAIVGGLLWIPYAEWRYLDRVHPRLAIGCLASAAALAIAVFPRRDNFEPPGPRLDEVSQRKLFTMLRSVADATKQEMPAEVFLVSDVNAWVTNRGGTMGFGSRRVMGLGLPLMQGLSVSEFKAVLAHEFGHYAAGDVSLGPWIYKTRAAIARVMESLGDSWLSVMFNAYGKLFLRLTLAVSRQQEFLADALAARVVHPAIMASALRRTRGLSPMFAAYWKSEVAPALDAGYLPPIATGFNQFLGSERVTVAMTRGVAAAIEEDDASPFDSHPPIRERLDALGRLPAPNVPLSSEPPASSLLENPDWHARELLSFAAGDEAVRQLREIAWDQLASQVYAANWRQMVARFAQFLTPHTADALPTDGAEYAKVGSSLPGGGTRSSDERIRMACNIVAAGVALNLISAGATLENQVGAPILFRKGGTTMDPFTEVPQVVSGEMPIDRWRAKCQAMGIAGRSLGPGAAAS